MRINAKCGYLKKAAARLTFVLTLQRSIYKTTDVATANLVPRRGLEQSLELLRSRLREISGVGCVFVSERSAVELAALVRSRIAL